MCYKIFYKMRDRTHVLGLVRKCVRIDAAAVAPAISHGFAPRVALVCFLGFISYKSACTSASCRWVHFGSLEYERRHCRECTSPAQSARCDVREPGCKRTSLLKHDALAFIAAIFPPSRWPWASAPRKCWITCLSLYAHCIRGFQW